MIKRKLIGQTVPELRSGTIGAQATLTAAERVIQTSSGIEVTSWLRGLPYLGFSRDGRSRAKVLITQKVLHALQDVPVEFAGFRHYSIYGRGQELLVLAARALAIQRKRKELRAQFLYSLPTDSDDEDTKLLYVEVVGRRGNLQDAGHLADHVLQVFGDG